MHDWALRQGELARGRAIGVHAAVVGIGYNSKALANKRLPEPRCWADLARPEYRNELHFVNPSASRVGYTTLATLVQVFGEERAFELMKAIHRNTGNYAVTANGAIRAVARAEATIGVAMLHDGATEIANGFPVQLIVPCEGTGYEVGSIALVALQFVASYLISAFRGNVAAVIFGPVIVVMLFFNIFAQLVLFIAAWIATAGHEAVPVPVEEEPVISPASDAADNLEEPPNVVPEAVAARSVRVGMGAGYVTGAATGVGLGAALAYVLSAAIRGRKKPKS